MTKEEKTVTIYKAIDGTEFMSQNECEQYENAIKEFNKNIKVFTLRHTPDLTETGYLCCEEFIIVYSAHFFHHEIALNYIINVLEIPIIGPSVQGYHYQNYYSLYNETQGISVLNGKTKECTLLAPVDKQEEIIKRLNLPKNIKRYDFIKKWGLNK